MARKFASGKFKLKNPDKYIGTGTPTYRSGWEFTFCKLLAKTVLRLYGS